MSYPQGGDRPGWELGTLDLHVEAIDFFPGNKVEAENGMACAVPAFSALLKAPPQPGLMILGDLSNQGNVRPVRSLVEPLPPVETLGPYDAYSSPERKSGGKGDRRKGDWRPWNGLAGRCGLGLILPRGPWSRLEDLELATLEWVWWFNNHRLLKPIGLVPSAEYEASYYLRLQTPPELETLNTHSLQ